MHAILWRHVLSQLRSRQKTVKSKYEFGEWNGDEELRANRKKKRKKKNAKS